MCSQANFVPSYEHHANLVHFSRTNSCADRGQICNTGRRTKSKIHVEIRFVFLELGTCSKFTEVFVRYGKYLQISYPKIVSFF